MKDFEATLKGDSERAIAWREIFGGDTCFLKSPLPLYVNLPGRPKTLVYELDIDLLTADQRQRLVTHLAQEFGQSQAFVNDHLDGIGCPILAEHLLLTIHNPLRWLDWDWDE